MQVLTIYRKPVLRTLVAFTALIFFIHVVSWVLKANGVGKVELFRLLFDVGMEANIAAFFSSLLFLISAGLLYIIHRAEGLALTWKDHWFLYALLFLFLAFDESGQIHEKLNKSMRALLGGGDLGLLNNAWILPYLVALAFLGLASIRFLKTVNPKTRNRMIIAGVVFIAGAVGSEMIGGDIRTEAGRDEINYMIAYTIEELLEFSGFVAPDKSVDDAPRECRGKHQCEIRGLITTQCPPDSGRCPLTSFMMKASFTLGMKDSDTST